MKARISITNPDKTLCTIEITMELGDWKRLKSELPGTWPGWELGQVIAELIDKAQSRFESQSEAKTR